MKLKTIENNKKDCGKVLLFDIHRVTYDFLSIVPEVPGLLALAAYLETRGYDPVVFNGEPAAVRAFLKEALEQYPILAVGFYCDFENQAEILAMSREITDTHHLPVLLGGPQVVGFDQDFLRESGCFVAVYGEGELVLTRILDSLSEKRDDVHQLDGIMYLDEKQELVKTPAARAIKDLDKLPFPAFHRWVNRPQKNNIRNVLTGRGCPFKCAFCYEGSTMRKLRLRSVPSVLREVETILTTEPQINYIAFLDDTFTSSRQRILELCQGFKQLQQKKKFGWFCEGHVTLLAKHPELLAEMVEAGLVRLQIGIESGVQKILNAYGKNITPNEIETVVRASAEAGLHQVLGFFLIGGPFESEQTLEQNKAFADRLIQMAPGVISLGPSPLMFYPDTAISRCPEKYGLRVLEHQGITTFADYPVTETDSMSREQIARNEQALVRHIFTAMKRVFHDGLVPHQRILDTFSDRQLYGLRSTWEGVVYRETPFVTGYYSLLVRGAVRRSCDIPAAEIGSWRPQRVFEMWHDMDFSEGFPRLHNEVLSPLQFELILYSTGKMTLQEVLQTVYEKFKSRFADRTEFEQSAEKILCGFEDKRQLAYCPI